MKRLLLIASTIIILSLLAFYPVLSGMAQVSQATSEELPVVGSYANLYEIIKKTAEQGAYLYGGAAVTATAESADTNMKQNNAEAISDAVYSQTNTQVQGVDEADIVKTDGEYIFQVNNQTIQIVKAYPADEMELVKTISFNDKEFWPSEIYIDDKYLVVIGSSNLYLPVEYNDSAAKTEMVVNQFQNTSKVYVYDLSNKSNPSLVREIELEGSYLSSRKIGSSVYLITNKYIDTYYILNNKNIEVPTPFYKDTVVGNEKINISYDEIHYFPDSTQSNYLMVSGFNLDKLDEELTIETYLGAGGNIYASTDNLYVTVTKYSQDKQTSDAGYPSYSSESTIYKFKLNKGNISFTHSGSVPGYVLNQFSMDEHNGNFRITTTTGDVWRNDEYTSKNHLYVLNEELQTIGKIEDIAPGERIYSVRFLGDRAYMVTFKKVDPLFVIDLKEPTAPKILGKLKIPGYSDYLHPYDENHLIGFGKDTVEDKNGAYYQGMKIALFDVSDVNNPKEKFVEIIGDRGTDSELLYNHKALLFSKETGLLAFPIMVMESQDENNIQQYGNFSFQGAYIYHLDLDSGFRLEEKITHLSDEDYQKAGYYWYDSNNNVSRILYINDALYTISNSTIKAHDMNTFNEISHLDIPINKADYNRDNVIR